MTKVPSNVKTLSALGLLPFLPGIVGTIQFAFITVQLNELLIEATLVYAALILSFLGGCIFGFETLALGAPDNTRLWLSITPTIWALISLSLPNFEALTLALGFFVMYELDRRTTIAKISPIWWLSLRLPLNGLVILALVVIGFHG
jgi:hypothetical protein